MTARSVAADLVDLTLAAAIAALPAHLLTLAWAAVSLPASGFPQGSADGPSIATRALVSLGMVIAVFVLLRWRLERDGQGPGKCLLSLRVENGKVVEDRDGLEPIERLGVFAGRFARPLLLGLASVLVLGLWGGAMERSVVQARRRQLLSRAYSHDAEYDCCTGLQTGHDCPRMLEFWAAVADRSDGKGEVPPRESLLERCPGARRYSRR
jgi:hypothetical protein